MALCSCDHIRRGDVPVPRSRTGFTSGDVFAIQESVFTPLTDILRNPISNLDRGRRSRSQISFNTLSTKKHATHKIRPCIVMRQRRIDEPFEICLAATFENAKMWSLPEIFGHFCIPMFPHDDISRDSGPHVHSLPEWPKPDVWVIAWRFRSTRPTLGHWTEDSKKYGRSQTWIFGQGALAVLNEECESRRLLWLEKCKDRRAALDYEKQFRDHYRSRGSRSQRSYHYDSPGDSAISMVNNFPPPMWHAPHSTTATVGYQNQSSHGGPSRGSGERRYYHHRSASYQNAGQSSHASLMDAMYRMQMDDVSTRSTRGTERYGRDRDDGDDRRSGKRSHFGRQFFSDFRR